jgi:hypothetical protein
MVKAIWNGKVIAEADRTEIVEGNHYFPSETLRREFFQPSEHHSTRGPSTGRSATPLKQHTTSQARRWLATCATKTLRQESMPFSPSGRRSGPSR